MSDSRRYHLDERQLVEGTSHAYVIQLVGDAPTVLDIGCATGVLMQQLRIRGKEVVGIELDPKAAALAVASGSDVRVGDIEKTPIVDLIGERRFDCIVMADILEHTRNPGSVLRNVARALEPGGFVVISVPNVAHASVMLGLMKGRLDYREKGLLDYTHTHLFTIDELRRVAAAGGLGVTHISRTIAGAFEVPAAIQVAIVPGEFSHDEVEFASRSSEAMTYQFVARLDLLVALDSEATGAAARGDEMLDRLSSALRQAQQRLVDLCLENEVLTRENASLANSASLLETTEAKAEAERHQLLIARDALIGAHGEVGSLRYALELRDHENHRLHLDIEARLDAVHSSWSWRLGHVALAPFRVLKRLFR
jgi:2-polyprenyl-3-methyl-5-hydroxy-6-metoxy-1,4-benzoquinol methylase